jgi:hypothetical protein
MKRPPPTTLRAVPGGARPPARQSGKEPAGGAFEQKVAKEAKSEGKGSHFEQKVTEEAEKSGTWVIFLSLPGGGGGGGLCGIGFSWK